jgi:hypothetical protein
MDIIGASNLKSINVLDELSFNSFHEKSERVFFVCKKGE